MPFKSPWAETRPLRANDSTATGGAQRKRQRTRCSRMLVGTRRSCKQIRSRAARSYNEQSRPRNPSTSRSNTNRAEQYLRNPHRRCTLAPRFHNTMRRLRQTHRQTHTTTSRTHPATMRRKYEALFQQDKHHCLTTKDRRFAKRFPCLPRCQHWSKIRTLPLAMDQRRPTARRTM